jgi:diguanylate cyclase (GGDEF)-like protein/PAS domain S-box-containing protein
MGNQESLYGESELAFGINDYRALIDHMLNGVAYCEMLYAEDGQPFDFIYIYSNLAFERLTGFSQVAGKRVSELIPGIRDKDPQLFEIYGRVANGGEPERFESYIESLKMWFWVSVYSPKAKHFVAIFDVITERKQAELDLCLANERWSLAQRAAACGTWYWDIITGEIYWSNEFYELFGLNPDKSPSSFDTWRSVLHEDDRDRAEQNIKLAIAQHCALTNEYRIILPSGDIRWIYALGDTCYDDNGTPHRMTGICIDITKDKHRELVLRESESRYRQMFQANPHPMWLYDLETLRFLAVNDAAIAHYGYSEAEFLAITIADIRPQEELPKLLDNIKYVKDTVLDKAGIWYHKKKDGTLIEVEITSHKLEFEGKQAEVVLAYDVTERRHAESQIHFLANYDPLTHLPNRNLLDDHLRYAKSLAKRSNGQLVLMFLDLDNFKDVNDTLGHSIGDTLLIELANRLLMSLREEDTVTRLGGDEFILLLPGVNADGAANVAQKLLDNISQPYQIDAYDLKLSASIGIAIYPDDGLDLEALCKCADIAMYQAKQEGRQGYRFFTPLMQARSLRNLQLTNALRHALENGEMQIHYQPQISIVGGSIIGAEALLRWQHPELGNISPAEFIPIAEDSGLILALGEWVLRCTVRQARIWQENLNVTLIMAVNLSAVQFRHPDLPDLVTRILDEEGLSPQYLELELTERVAMHNPEGAISVINNLYKRGIRMSIDDFGTGYSSLSYLKKFKLYKVKIDQSFVRDITTDSEDKAIVTAVISLAKSLGLKTIAEGVETEQQAMFLREQGCDELQGYLFSKPMPAHQFEELLMEGPSTHKCYD